MDRDRRLIGEGTFHDTRRPLSVQDLWGRIRHQPYPILSDYREVSAPVTPASDSRDDCPCDVSGRDRWDPDEDDTRRQWKMQPETQLTEALVNVMMTRPSFTAWAKTFRSDTPGESVRIHRT